LPSFGGVHGEYAVKNSRRHVGSSRCRHVGSSRCRHVGSSRLGAALVRVSQGEFGSLFCGGVVGLGHMAKRFGHAISVGAATCGSPAPCCRGPAGSGWRVLEGACSIRSWRDLRDGCRDRRTLRRVVAGAR